MVHLIIQEIDRVLRVGGRYVCVSLLQEHVLLKFLDYFPKAGWMFRVCRCVEAENKSVESGEGPGLPVFVTICTKFKKLPNFQQVSFFILIYVVVQYCLLMCNFIF